MRRARFACTALVLLSTAALGTEPALTGQVSSREEGVMEGVLVSAKKAGSRITVTVVTDDKGRYVFPAAKLGAGTYSLDIRAIGYELATPRKVGVSSGRTATAELNLKPVPDLSTQLSNGEWIASVPATDDQRRFLYGCVNCHTLERVMRSRHNGEQFLKEVMVRMTEYASMSFHKAPQKRLVARNMARGFGPDATRMAEFLASVNLSRTDKWAYPLRTLPRPSGRATRVVITEYGLARETTQPHDVVVDSEGTVWFTHFGEQLFSRLDPKTGQVKEYRLPTHRPGFPLGTLDLETDEQGNFWISMMNQGGVAKFDRKTETFETWPIPARMANDETQQSMVGPQHWQVDGKVWLNDTDTPGLSRLDLKTGRMEPWWAPYKNRPRGEPHSVYGIYADKQNNVYFNDFGGENIGRIDARTGEVKLYPTPTPRSRPRRGRMDDEERLWFAEWRMDKIGMFDTKTEKFTEWNVPTPWSAPYDVAKDRNGELWSGNMNNDRILRFDPKTGRSVEYLLPKQTNVRRVFVDNRTTPVTFWVGNNHGAAVIKLEPLD